MFISKSCMKSSRRKFIIGGSVILAGTLVGGVTTMDLLSYFNKNKNIRNLNKELYDYGIVCGFGITPDGKLPLVGQKRMDVGIELYFNKKVRRLLVSEGKTVDRISGARVMANYALEKSVPSSDLELDEESMTTPGNAFYTKVNHFLPSNRTTNVVVTSGKHMPRTKYLFDEFLGSLFWTDYYSETSGLFDNGMQEFAYLAMYKGFLSGIESGNHEALRSRLEFWRNLTGIPLF